MEDLTQTLNNLSLQKVKPILKWVGGKSKIAQEILSQFPKEIDNYHEPFVGGGSVLLSLLSSSVKVKCKIYAYDFNQDLINFYKHIQTDAQEIIKKFKELKEEFDTITEDEVIRKHPNDEKKLSSKESYYYWLRNQYNNISENSIYKSALFLFLNKTCFRGLYRIGPNGFNVPYGNYKNLNIDEQNILNVSRLIKDVIFTYCHFQVSLKQIRKGDFVYLDPPYYPEKDDSFVKYTKLGFDKQEHDKLFSICKELNNQKIKFIMSNSDTSYVKENFSDYKKKTLCVQRQINSKNPGSQTNEILVFNY